MIGLTKQQRRLLTYLREYIGQNRYAPSFEELRAAMRLSSTSGIWRLVEALQERGYIHRNYGKTRDITLNDPPVFINGRPYRFIPITPGVVNPFKSSPWKAR